MKKILTLVGILVVIVILGLAFSSFMKSSYTKVTNENVSSTTDTISTSTDTTNTKSSTTTTKPKTTVSTQTSSSHVYVDILDYTYNPKALTIKAGTTVTWTNRDSAIHTVTADNSGPASPNFGKGQTYSYKFTTKGIYGYHCALHRNMTGTVVVQ